MENHYGRSPLKEAMDKINAQEKRRRNKKLIGTIILGIAIYFTITLYDWKLALIIIAYLTGNNLESNNQ